MNRRRRTAALAPMYEKPKSSTLHRSLHGIWWLLEIFPHRYYDKDDAAVKRRIPLGAYRKIPRGSLVHPSVQDKFKSPCYQPRNISNAELAKSTVPIGNNPDAGVYLQFESTACRHYRWRQNWFVVFLVTVAELGIGFYLAAWLAFLMYRHVHPLEIAATSQRWWLVVGNFSTSHYDRLGRMGDLRDSMIAAALAVIVGRLFSWATKRRV